MAAGQSVWLLCLVDRLVMLVRLGQANLVLQAVTWGQLVGLNSSLILGNIYVHIAFYMVWNFGDTMDHIFFFIIRVIYFCINIVQ